MATCLPSHQNTDKPGFYKSSWHSLPLADFLISRNCSLAFTNSFTPILNRKKDACTNRKEKENFTGEHLKISMSHQGKFPGCTAGFRNFSFPVQLQTYGTLTTTSTQRPAQLMMESLDLGTGTSRAREPYQERGLCQSFKGWGMEIFWWKIEMSDLWYGLEHEQLII